MAMYNILFYSGATLLNVDEKAAFQATSVPEVRYIQNAETGELVWGMDYDNPVFEDDNKPEKADNEDPIPFGFDVPYGDPTDAESLKKLGLCFPYYVELKLKERGGFTTTIYQFETPEAYTYAMDDIHTQHVNHDNTWETDCTICKAEFYVLDDKTGRYALDYRIQF